MPIAEADRQRIVQSVRAYIARERMSREEFAARAKLGKSTVDKLVVGIFSEKTVLQIEQQLKLRLLDAPATGDTAPDELGRYTRADTTNYIGEFVFARPSFREDGTIQAFHMRIEWDTNVHALLVKEAAPRRKQMPLQLGTVYIPRASMYIFILSNDEGWLKKVILSQLDAYKRMKGILLTMGNAFANVYTPVAMPVIMNKYDTIDADMTGEIGPRSRMYEEYLNDLVAVEQSRYAKWIRIKQP